MNLLLLTQNMSEIDEKKLRELLCFNRILESLFFNNTNIEGSAMGRCLEFFVEISNSVTYTFWSYQELDKDITYI